MSYSTGPGGYGDPSQGAGGGQGGYGQSASDYGTSPGQGKGLPFFLNVGVIALGVVSLFLGFAPFAKEDKEARGSGIFEKTSLSFFDNFSMGVGVIALSALFAAALIAAFSLLPKQEKNNDAVVAGLSVTGFVTLLFLLIGLTEGLTAGIGLILVLVTSFLQAALAVGSLLFSSGIIKPPQPKQAQYGGYYGQTPYGQAPPQQPYYGGGAGGPGTTPSYQPPPSQPQQQPPSQPPPSQPPQNPQNPW